MSSAKGMNRRTSGFTLVELMIVVAIIGILAAIAFPAYQDYAKRAKISEALTALSQCRTEISHYFQIMGALPSAPNAFGCEKLTPATSYVASILTGIDGSIGATLQSVDPTVNGKVVQMIPLTAAGVPYTNATLSGGKPIYQWRCGSRTLGALATRTTLDPNFLPSSCRG